MSLSVSCQSCGATPDSPEVFARVASISGSIMGNEHIESLYYCRRCGCYTLERYIDYFDGRESSSIEGPISQEKGDLMVAIISRCKTPYEKRCRCSAHLEYFGGSLD
jgi:hypothetical protein